MADALTEIFRAASKHPNSRVSKLIHQVEEQPTQKNIVLLLIELAEHAEYSIDFNVSLKYYLDLFERCGINHDLVLNEAGILLVNSSKIYSKRVDYVQSLVERQILTLSNADDELEKQRLEQEQTENATSAEKPRRGRKRALEAPSDPYEVELAPKKFKKLTEEKRFAPPKAAAKPKPMTRNIEMEPHIHPAGWQHATIFDFENEEDVDTKRNYKLFTYHVEHRYNTLVPDINFRLHFKVKDYMDEQEEMEEDEACNTDRSWPPLSEAYVEKYLRLENYVLGQEMKSNKRKSTDQEGQTRTEAKVINIQPAYGTQQQADVCNTSNSINSKNNTDIQSNTLDNSVENFLTNLDMNLANKSRESLESSKIYHNDSGLGRSILDETNNTLENSQLSSRLGVSQTQESLSENNKSTAYTENDSALGSSVLEESNTEINESLSTTSKNDLTLETSVADKPSGNTKHIDTTEENETSLHADVIKNDTSSTENNATTEINEPAQTHHDSTCKTIDANNEIFNTSSEDGQDLKQFHNEELAKATDSRKDSALSDGHSHLISAENLELSKKNDFKSGKSISIDVVEEQDKNSTQIHVHLPSADDEGVCLSDLEEHECRLLSPIIKTTNILPGVERKDITIIMDDELRQALEMRDGIIKHFGNETFTVPVVAEPRKANLIFNILQLPEKVVRRKILFKLGPDMDLYIQARCLKRNRADPVARTGRNFQLLKWFSLNNTDMTGVCVTPAQSPGHVSEFYGFSDNEDDTMSCIDFCGFTAEEQLTLNTKSISRLSRDSGVGVDVTNLTPDKETLDIIFEEAADLAVRNTLNSNKKEIETMENIMQQLPDDIRNVLSLELEENSDDNKGATNDINSKAPITSNNSQEVNNLETQLTDNFCSDKTTHINTESTEALLSPNINKESEKSSENCCLTRTQDIENVLTENVNGTQEIADKTESESNTEALKYADVSKPSMQLSDKSAEELTREELFFASCEEPEDSMNVADDDGIILDMDSEGTKTKIQKWHERLKPILAKSRERHHFDVYKLGTEIIDTVQSKTTPTLNSFDEFSNSSTASFENVMEDKDKSYVSRYFLSTLLLANQSNIEISIQNKSSEKPSAWHDINLKLLSAKRHTVAIEDNIGMTDSKQKTTKAQTLQQSAQQVNKKSATDHQNEGGHGKEEPLMRLESTAAKLKSPSKRNSEYATASCIAEKKPKDNLFATFATKRQHTTSPAVVESVQILQPPFAASNSNNAVQPSTSHQGQYKHLALFNVNMNAIRTLQPIEKVQKRSDDHDSGIFSVDEMSTS